jgi:hypothetical protein
MIERFKYLMIEKELLFGIAGHYVEQQEKQTNK